MGQIDVYTKVTRFDVSCFPADHEEHGHFSVIVEYRGRGLWAVVRHGQCLNADGGWDYEMRTSEREDEWLAAHRFSAREALRRAEEIAPTLTVNGWAVEDVKLKRDRPTGGRHGR